MERNFLYVYERIYKGRNAMEERFRQIPICGKRTLPSDLRRIRKVISNETYKIARECSVAVGYPKMRIEGNKVILGEESILLPNLKYVTMAQLKRIECG